MYAQPVSAIWGISLPNFLLSIYKLDKTQNKLLNRHAYSIEVKHPNEKKYNKKNLLVDT